MPELTQKQRNFVREYVTHGNGTQAYAAAFGASCRTPAVQACKLLKKPSIQKAIENLRGKMAEMREDLPKAEATDALLTIQAHMKRLQDLAKKAETDKKWAAAIQAEVKCGELMGYYIQRSENLNCNYTISEDPITADEWASEYASEPSEPASATTH